MLKSIFSVSMNSQQFILSEEKMPEIKVLPEEVIAKIAAGEVIERPASVLKELLENSADAGASRIDIDIEKAGKKLIRVRDDGKGMGQEDMKTALLRHSTSKLRNFDDIYSLATFGFRGEALYSIAAVSRLKITSCTENAETAFSLECEGGTIKSMQPAPPVKGTAIEAADLFFNIPARAKFLKSDASERAHLIRTAEEAALAGCTAAFRMAIDGTEIFSVPLLQGGIKANLRRRTETVLGKKTFSGMEEIDFSGGGIKIYGFVSNMSSFCSTRANQYYFVNRRPVTSQLLKQAFYKAYPSIPVGKHPSCVLFVELDPSEFDVNVHPQKKDVKFSREGDIFSAMAAALRQAIDNRANTDLPSPAADNAERSHADYAMPTGIGTEPAAPGYNAAQPQCNSAVPVPPGGIYGRGIPPTVKYRAADNDIFPPDLPGEGKSGDNAADYYGKPENIPGVTKGTANAAGIAAGLRGAGVASDNGLFAALSPEAAGGSPSVIPEENSAVPEDPSQIWKTASLKYIGQLADSYLLFECNRGLLAVDQHAAEERVLFEQYLDQLSQKTIIRQTLLVPIEAELTRSQAENVMRWQEWLDGAGFEIDSRGPETVLLRSAPDMFSFNEKTFSEFVSYLAEVMGSPSRVAEDMKRNLVATMACKKAVKAMDSVRPEFAMDLMKRLRQCRDGAHCPHGRPTMYYMPGTELARKFDRGAAL